MPSKTKKTPKKLRLITVKDIVTECECSTSTARRIYLEIKEENQLKRKPTYHHLCNYLGV